MTRIRMLSKTHRRDRTPRLILILLLSLITVITIPLIQAASWTGPTVVTSNSLNHYSPAVVQDKTGNVYLFWDQNPGIYYIVTTTGQIASGTWPAPKVYTHGTNFDVTPAPVALKNGTLVLFFSRKNANTYNIYYSISNDNGRTLSSDTQISDKHIYVSPDK